MRSVTIVVAAPDSVPIARRRGAASRAEGVSSLIVQWVPELASVVSSTLHHSIRWWCPGQRQQLLKSGGTPPSLELGTAPAVTPVTMRDALAERRLAYVPQENLNSQNPPASRSRRVD